MPNALGITGLQHVIDNLNKETASRLQGWESFKDDLNNFEAFLTRRELVDTFIWSCLRGHEGHMHTQKSFERWGATLYDKRWREVVNFLEKLVPLLPTLRATWSEGRFTAAVDADTGVKATKEGSLFNLGTLTASLHSPLFGSYARMVLRLELITRRPGSWAESCPCHRILFEHASQELPTARRLDAFRRECLGRHFGPGTTTCQLAGFMAPELVGGGMEATVTRVCS